VGKVLNIGFDPEVTGNVLIRIAVNEEAPISPATFASLGYQGVTGLAHVLLDDDDKPNPEQTTGESGIPRLPLKPSPFGQLADQAPAILEKVQEATIRLNQLMSDDNQAKVSAALGNISQAAAGVSTLARTVDNSISTRLNPALASIPPLAKDASSTLRTLQQVGQQAVTVTTDIGNVLQTLSQPGGAVDNLTRSTQSLAHAANVMTATTLPRINRAADEARTTIQRWGRMASGVQDNPQMFIYGNGAIPPGPGELGFTATAMPISAIAAP
jgi:phospholipid/cholesterol/gamma-HCH transport system substrate-binding protein